MSSYNRINGPFTQENRELLTTILRDEWGFDGIVMTDWTGLRNTAAQIHAGNDLMEPGNEAQIKDIMDKVKSGALSEADLDICVKRILQYLVKTPAFRAYKYSNKPDLKVTASITVTNTGQRIGKEVVELYVSAPAGGLDKPARELKAFAKTRELQPGQSETLTMPLSLYDLASYNEATQAWETAPGRYTIAFGASSEDIRATASYTLSKPYTVKCHDVMKPDMPL